MYKYKLQTIYLFMIYLTMLEVAQSTQNWKGCGGVMVMAYGEALP
jgi:hypothetical protein